MAEMDSQVPTEDTAPAPGIEDNNLVGLQAPAQPETIQPIFKKYEDTKIPVPKSYGPMWKSRMKAAAAAARKFANGHEEAIRYYNNVQTNHRRSIDGKSGNTTNARRLNETHTETENIVFATVNAVTPAIYAKNPTAEITPDFSETPANDDAAASDLRAFARCCEKLINGLANKNHAPGFAMKIKAKQATIHAQLTNEAWVEYGYTIKEQSREGAMEQVAAVLTALDTAKDENEIRAREGELLALYEQLDTLQPEGPFVRFRRARDVLVDPDAECPMYSDAQWMMYPHMFSTDYLNAVYRKADANGVMRSIYEPTHVVDAGESSATDEMINNFKLFDTSDTKAQSYGYDDNDSFKKACRTKVWIVWDKTTRRMLMFHDKDWSWPIWVWDDPYGLPNFFPLEKLSFIIPAEGARAMSEVSYYLDQQDAINECNDEMRRIRLWARRNIFYNTNVISPNEFEKVMKGNDGTGNGVALPPGDKLSDHIFSFVPPSINYAQLFDVQSKIAAIDRITGTSVIMRNEQFKTNTTNEAIGAYTSANQTRLDDKIDSVEDWIGRTYYGILFLCVRFMRKEQVATVVGDRIAAAWRNMEPREFVAKFPMRIEGGSTQKPTSSAKKKEATGMAQVLGQFANTTPAVFEIALKALEKAFDEIVITEEDWKYIRETAMQQMNRGMSTGPGTGVGGPPSQNAMDVLAVIDQLPDQAKQAFATAIARGASAGEALKQIMDALQQQGRPAA